MQRQFKKGQKITINGRQHVVARVWKSGKVKLFESRYPSLFILLSSKYLSEQGEF